MSIQTISARALLILAMLSTLPANAADELALFVVNGSEISDGTSIALDGVDAGRTGRDGFFNADLSDGTHVLTVTATSGETSTVRWSNGSGQLVDVVVDLASPQSARVDVYSRVESSAERRDAGSGRVVVDVRKGVAPAANQMVIFSSGEGAVNSDGNGRVEKSLPRGLYTVSAAGQSRTVRVLAGVTRAVRLNLPAEDEAFAIELPSLEEVFVVATFDPNDFEVSERDTANIVDTIGVEMLTRFGDSDVASAVLRAPGISVQDDQYVFIRGLGDRYVTSTLNNATMPSTNPTKRTVPLDLFPSSFVSQLDIKKSFLPYMPGETTGGNLVINTKTFPDEPGGSVSVSMGAVSGLTGQTVAVDSLEGDFDIIGWDDGTREEDIVVQAVVELLTAGTFVADDGNTYTLDQNLRGELGRLAGIQIKDGWDPAFESTTPDAGLSLNYGDLFYFDDAELGFYAAANYSNEWSMNDKGIRRSYTASGFLADDQVFKSATNNIDASGLLSVGLNIGDTTLEWNNFVSRSTAAFFERSVGEEGDEFQSIYGHTSQWEERQYLSTQLLGSHFLNETGSVFGEWQLTASQAKRYVPGRVDVRFRTAQQNTDADTLRADYDFSQSNGRQTALLQGFNFEPGNSNKRWDELIDNNFDASFDVTWDFLDDGDSFASLRLGAQAIYREREADSATYGYFKDSRNATLRSAPNVLVSDVIYVCGEGEGTVSCPLVVAENGDVSPALGGVQDNARTGYLFAIRTAVSDEYTAELNYNSVYAMVDYTLGLDWQVIAGVRYEMYDQTTDTFDLTTGAPVQGVIDESVALPSLGINWFYAEDQQLRLAVSQTIARPDFKEASNAVYFDNEFNVRVRGNKDLQTSDILNVDLRWEWYFGDNDDDVLSVAAFYKDMTDPIERVVQPASGTAENSRTFQNSDSAELYGIEVEGRKEFLIGGSYDQTVFVSFNAAYIESEVLALNQAARPLQGQPEYTGNIVMGYDDFLGGHQLTLLYNQNGASIADVGVSGAPDVYLEPRGELNLVYRYDLSDSATLKLKIENILNEPVEYTQGGLVFQRYEKGSAVSMSFDWHF